MNTKQSGILDLMIFREKKEDLFTGVCLNFGIVVQDKKLEVVEESLKEGVIGYLKAVKKANLGDELLNNQAEKKYYDLYRQCLNQRLQQVNNQTNLSNPLKHFCFIKHLSEPINKNIKCPTD